MVVGWVRTPRTPKWSDANVERPVSPPGRTGLLGLRVSISGLLLRQRGRFHGSGTRAFLGAFGRYERGLLALLLGARFATNVAPGSTTKATSGMASTARTAFRRWFRVEMETDWQAIWWSGGA